MYKKLIRALCVMTAAAMMLASCSGGSNNASSGGAASGGGETAKKDTVVERALADQKTFDPFKTSDINDQKAHYQIYDSLFREEPDGSIVPALCTEYKFNDAGDEITFTIREGVKFHNGETMTADDVAFSLNTAIGSPYTTKMTGTMEKATKIDDKTVVLKLKHAFAPILGCLVSSSCSIVPKAAYEADPDSFATKPIGTGPYMLKEVKRGEKISYDAFPDYYRGEAPIKHLIDRIIPDDSAALMAFESGELDIMQPSQAYTDRQAIIDNPNLTYYEAEQACYFLIAFNNEKGIFSNKDLRDAVSYAVDREDLIAGAVNGMAVPVEAAMVPACPQYPADFKGHEYNLDKAKELMAKAGYPDGFDVTMRVIGAANYTKPAEVLQAQLKKIGINMKVEAMERGTWFDVVYSGGDYEITFYAVPISVYDADFATYSMFHSSEADGKGGNYTNCKIPELDKLLDEGRASQDEAERKEIYRKVCEIVRDNSVVIPCYTGKRTMAAVKELKGMYADPMMRYYVYNYSW